MTDRAELVEAALAAYREGLALLDVDDRVIFWNRTAESITGYSSARLLGMHLPGPLEAVTQGPVCEPDDKIRPCVSGAVVHAQHLRGQDLPLMTRRMVLRDGLGERIGSAALFHYADHSAALPHPDSAADEELVEGRADLEERVRMKYEACRDGGVPFGVLWIEVDQGASLRKSHGSQACEEMLEAVERTLANALLAGEELGRWSEDEFLLTAHESSTESMTKRAQALAGMARTTVFRWWGDRVSITVSIGVAVPMLGESLKEMLGRARQAMQDSSQTGGNRVSAAPGRRS